MYEAKIPRPKKIKVIIPFVLSAIPKFQIKRNISRSTTYKRIEAKIKLFRSLLIERLNQCSKIGVTNYLLVNTVSIKPAGMYQKNNKRDASQLQPQ